MIRKLLGVRGVAVTGIALVLLLGSGLFFTLRGCGHGAGTVTAGFKYQCSMHPQIVQDHPGTCPICHMDLVKVEVNPPVAVAVKGKKIVRYRNPMDPSKFSDKPMKDSMGMDYIPVYSDEPAAEASGAKAGKSGRVPFMLSERRQQLIGVKWTVAGKRKLSSRLRLPGRGNGSRTVAAELLEIDAGTVKPGMRARIIGPQDRAVDAEVSDIDPNFDAVTRSYAVTLETLEEAGWLKSGVYCEVSVIMNFGEKLAIPLDSVLYGGERRIVFVTDGKGMFRPVEVRLGKTAEDWVEVLSGLKEGERVVTSANFLIDSESRFKAALEQF